MSDLVGNPKDWLSCVVMRIYNLDHAPIAQVVERPLQDREVAGSILGRAIPKA